MGRSVFRSHQFSIHQDRCAMKVSTDGIILGCIAHVAHAKSVLDIGTGTGLLSLMCAQRNALSQVDAIEIDSAAFEQAKENVAASPWANRISVLLANVRDYTSPKYDAIICNPPFYEADLKSHSQGRNVAMHSESISLAALLESTAALLNISGKASFIFPTERKQEFFEKAQALGLYPISVTDIHYVQGKPSIRFVTVLGFTQQDIVEESLIIQSPDNQYTDQYKKLSSEFLLKRSSD